MKSFVLAVVLAHLIVTPATATEPVDAVWTAHDVDFTFIGLDVAYSCDLLEGRIETLLRHVGATEIDVTVPACGAFKTPQKQLRVLARFSTLVPAGADDVDTIKATWNEVVLDDKHPRSINDRDCQLLEQFQEYVLSTIEHEVVEGALECSVSKRSIVGRLKIRVLEPVAVHSQTETVD